MTLPFMRIEKMLLCCFLLALLGVAVSEVHSFDIFWQLQSGRYVLETKSFIYRDIFSLAADAPRFEHCWLHDVTFYLAYLLGGYGAISVLKGVLITSVAGVLVATARVRASSWLSILLILPPAMLMGRGGWLERPQLWSFLFFALFLLVLERFRSGRGRVFVLIPLMVLWANLHAGAILALPVMAAYLAGEGGAVLLRRSPLPERRYRKLWLCLLGVAAAALVTPYGLQLLEALLTTPQAGSSTAPITQLYNMDWRATSFARDRFFFYAMGVSALLLLLGWRRLALTDLLLLAGLAFMGVKLSRHTPFFFFALGAILPRYGDAFVLPICSRFGAKARLALRGAGQVVAAALVVYFMLPAHSTYGFFTTGLRDWHYPIEASEFVRDNRLPGNLYNTYDWGGYLMWTLYPDYKVFWDGRSDSPEMFKLGLQVMSGHPGWERILDRFEVKTVVTKACTVDTGQRYPVIDRLREHPEWALVFADESAMVFVREAAVNEDWLRRYRLPGHRVDDTILSEAILLTGVNPGRYKGWWEMARIYMTRKDYSKAFAALEQYLSRSPVRDPVAENYYRTIYPMMKRQGAER